ncbi:MAG: hypothetical protein FJ356_01975 [Thaumarchaeota archaeon]|nr:hypothetical protein [Nitrososphaerota archaeon]
MAKSVIEIIELFGIGFLMSGFASGLIIIQTNFLLGVSLVIASFIPTGITTFYRILQGRKVTLRYYKKFNPDLM